jgi:hypothetical protein
VCCSSILGMRTGVLRLGSATARMGDLGAGSQQRKESAMSKRARKRRDRKRGGANHGKRPNT